MFDVKQETSYEAFVECIRLGEAHYEEVEMDKTDIPFNIDWDLVKLYHDAGIITFVTTRVDGDLVGYFGSIISKDLYTSTLSAAELGIYLKPEYRKGTAFIKMLKLIEQILTDKGVKKNLIMFKCGHNENLGERLGYQRTEITYQKFLGE